MNKQSQPSLEEKIYTRALIEKDEKGGMLAVASEEIEDRMGDVVSIDGWDLKNFKKNPLLLWMHNMTVERSLPIGYVKNISIKEISGKKKLVFEPVFEEITEFGKTVKKFFEEGLLNAFSVGFIAREFDPATYKITRQELLEISAVTVPALQTALVLQRAQDMTGLDKKVAEVLAKGEPLPEDVIEKAVIKKNYELASENHIWDAKIAAKRLREAKIKMSGWEEELSHHDIVNGKEVVVLRGVQEAMAYLLGAKGSTEILDKSAREDIYKHLAHHYIEFGKVAPDYELVEKQVLSGLDEELKTVYFDKAVSTLNAEIKSLKSEIKKRDEVLSKELVDSLTVKILKGLDVAISKKLKGGDK